MAEPKKAQMQRTFESAAFDLQGVRLKAMDDADLDMVLKRARSNPAVVKAAQREGLPLTREAVMRLIAVLKDI